MTKQEHIKEMVNILAASNNPFVDVPIEIMPKVAEALYNSGYRKLPENSVVLSREEYEDYKKHVDNCVEEYHRGQHEAEVYYKNIQIPRERKETAKKIIIFLKEYIAKQFDVEIKVYEK